MIFRNREEAGERLGRSLRKYKGKDVLVLGLARGGVPVAAEVAGVLGADFDVYVVRKVGAPKNPELAIGAIAPGAVSYWDKLTIKSLGVTEKEVEQLVKKELLELTRRIRKFRRDTPPPVIKGKVIILVDDGIATGASLKAAIRSVLKQKPRKVVVGVPVCCNPEVVEEIRGLVDEVVCLESSMRLRSVAEGYPEFEQVGDKDVLEILR
jgi:putative phosphoribosyl transferase